MVSLILILSVNAFNVLVLILSPSVGLISARIRRSGTKVFVNNIYASTAMRCLSSGYLSELGNLGLRGFLGLGNVGVQKCVTRMGFFV